MDKASGFPIQKFGLSFHHLGLASKLPELTIQLLQGLGYRMTDQIYDPLQNVNLRLCTHAEMPTMELVTPSDTAGPLDKILATSNESIYHICYEASDPEKSIKAIKAEGHRVICVSSPKPAVLFDERRVSFYMVKGIGLIELLEKTDATN